MKDCLNKWKAGDVLSDSEIINAHPELMPELAAELKMVRMIVEAEAGGCASVQPISVATADTLPSPSSHPYQFQVQCPDCQSVQSVSVVDSDQLTCPGCGHTIRVAVPKLIPRSSRTFSGQAAQSLVHERIGRYVVKRVLGAGGFGKVFLAVDEELNRTVAIKVPHAHQISRVDDVEAYLREARIVASLDHPAIVPVYDVGRTDDGLCYVVSKYIAGGSLDRLIGSDLDSSKNSKQHFRRAAEIVKCIAEALHYAHTKDLVHRDVKPANILIDDAGSAYITDFGLAIHEWDLDPGSSRAGTPRYMSPEQARGESHLVDGRSDIFSLGIVLYELLTGVPPFQARTVKQMIERIIAGNPRPPRQRNAAIPKQLERICLKMLASRAADRYPAAIDLAEDLRCFLDEATGQSHESLRLDHASLSRRSLLDSTMGIAVVPKGLRSFDFNDADFFLTLLPGPVDRTGLPESVRFWKYRIEDTNPLNTFRAGVVYGPSGCGKSSLVKAGLVPLLNDSVVPLLVESTASGTLDRLRSAIQQRWRSLTEGGSLVTTLAEIRRNRGLPAGKKLLIVLDQFEQFLNGAATDELNELTSALRHCDGTAVQCLLLVRDDFWSPLSRFMQQLEVPIVEGQNSRFVDLFEPRHARNVLVRFGRAYGCLPEFPEELTDSARAFVDSAIDQLQVNGKIVAVRLAVFSEMMKGKAWEPLTLKRLGGPEGIGAQFLDETLGEQSTNPEFRRHQAAARAILGALLPNSSSLIKGGSRSRSALWEACEQAKQAARFDSAMRILDHELRLITPADPEVTDDDTQQQHYQLTHDYLVPPLREWLLRKQKETRRGRAALLLADRTTSWQMNPTNRMLPSFREWLNIAWLVPKRSRTEPQRELMRKAARLHLTHAAAFLSVGAALLLSGYFFNRRQRAFYITDGLLGSAIGETVDYVNKLVPYMQSSRAVLEAIDPKDRDQHLRACLALLPHDAARAISLRHHLLTANADELRVITEFLGRYSAETIIGLARDVTNENLSPDQRFRAACAVVTLDPTKANDWQPRHFQLLAEQLVEASWTTAPDAGAWGPVLSPIGKVLVQSLGQMSRDPKLRSEVRWQASRLALKYGSDDSGLLVSMLGNPDMELLRYSLPVIEEYPNRRQMLAELRKVLDQAHSPRQTAAAAAAIVRLTGQLSAAHELLGKIEDPTTGSHLVHVLGLSGIDPLVVVAGIQGESRATIRRDLLLALGEFNERQLPESKRQAVIGKIMDHYRNDPDPGVHGAAEWLLRKWGQADSLREARMELARDPDRHTGRDWFVNSLGQTFAILDATTVWIGSPSNEAGRIPGSEPIRQQRTLDRHFAISIHETTNRELQQFVAEEFKEYKVLSNDQLDLPGTFSWYQAAHFCNWLSQKEGLSLCYRPNALGKFAEGMGVQDDYRERDGYRLPTEEEWEFACRSGSVTRFYHGDDDALLTYYAWYGWPQEKLLKETVGLLKPNRFGLFDMLGNVWEWTSTPYTKDREKLGPSNELLTNVTNEGTVIVLRGGAYVEGWRMVRSSAAFFESPSVRTGTTGFRIVRTLN
jgi:serine/threonine protein kinase/formylglycine-generating enzyme required for sulfatase activity